MAQAEAEAAAVAPTLAVDVGGTSTRIAIVAGGEIVSRTYREFRTSEFQNGDDLVSAIHDHASEFQTLHSTGVGVCVPALLSDDLGTPEYCPNTPVLEGYPLGARLRQRLSMPVRLEVDCNAAALAEFHFGAGRGFARLVVVSLGTGVGVGVLDRGRPLRHTGGCFGDLGHIYVGGERRCTAGCRGCLESNVSVEALGGGSPASLVRSLVEAARAGEPDAVRIFEDAGNSVGIALASMSSFLRPDLVLLAGGLAEAGDCLIAAASRAFQDHAARHFVCPVRKGALGACAALIGAASAAREGSET